MKFSQRMGYTPIKSVIQKDGIDDDLKNGLWNVIFNSFLDLIDGLDQRSQVHIYDAIWVGFFKQAIDTSKGLQMRYYIRNWFFVDAEWYHIYDFIEFSLKINDLIIETLIKANSSGSSTHKEKLKKEFNQVLEKELSAYRIIDNKVTPIIDEIEITSIEDAIQNSNTYTPVNKHLKEAVRCFSNRKAPDYRTSIKESISAVEAMCRIILNDDRVTLGNAIKRINSKIEIHGAMQMAFSDLYGYTSDSSGIRHSMTESDIPVSFEDAKFMLIACSAFTSYLIAQNDKITSK